MTLKHISYCLLMMCWAIISSGQSQVIQGNVVDQNGDLISYGEVVLKSRADTSIVAFSFIFNGKYVLDAANNGQYFLEVNCLGFVKQTLGITLEEAIQIDFILKEEIALLDEVTISADRPVISVSQGNVKINLANSPLTALPTALDVLSRLPGLLMGSDGRSINVLGQGNPIIYLGNQRIDLDQLLAIAVESIKDVEIIYNPPAKYEAEGRVVLLITKKDNLSNGYQISLSENAAWRRNFSNYLTANGSWKKDRLEFRGSVAINFLKPWESLGSSFEFEKNEFSSEYVAIASGDRPQQILNGGLHYQINKGDYISFNSTLRQHTSDAPINTESSTLLKSQRIDALTNAENDEKRRYLSTNVNYNKKLGASTNLFTGFQLSDYSRKLKTDLFNNFNNAGAALEEKRDQEFSISAYAGRVDLEKKINENLSVEVGSNISYATSNSFLEVRNLQNILIVNIDFLYRENNYAYYAQLSGGSGKISYVLGLRSESTKVQSGIKDEPFLIDRKRTVLFPNLNFDYRLQEGQTINFSFASSIRRPNYLSANSLRNFINPFLEFSGNISLRPTITRDLSLTYNYKSHVLKVNAFKSVDPSQLSFFEIPGTDRLVMKPDNIDASRGVSMTLTSPFRYKFWSTTNSLRASYIRFTDEEAISGKSKPYLYYYTDNRFQLFKDTHIGFTVYGLTKRYEGIFERNAFLVNNFYFGTRIADKVNLTIQFSDAFRALKYTDRINQNGIGIENTFFLDAKEISLGLRYSFGKTTPSDFQNKDVDENLGRIR